MFLYSLPVAVLILILFACAIVPDNVALVLIVNPVALTPEKETFVPAVIKIGSSSPLEASSNN